MDTSTPSTALQQRTTARRPSQTTQESHTTAQFPRPPKDERALLNLASLYHSLTVLIVALHLIYFSLSYLQSSWTDNAERARMEYDSMLNETVKEAWVRSTLPQLYEESLLSLPRETHRECLSRGALYAHNRLGRYYMDYPDVCDSTVDWVQSNCDALFWTPQVVVTQVVEVQHLTGWALKRAFVQHHTEKLLDRFKSWISRSFPPDVQAQSVTSPTPKPTQLANPRPASLPAHFRIVDCTENPPWKLVCIPTSKAASISPSRDMLEAAKRTADRAWGLAKRGDLALNLFGFVMLLFMALGFAANIAGDTCAERLADGRHGMQFPSKSRILWEIKWYHASALQSMLPFTWGLLWLFGVKLLDYRIVPSIGLVGGYVLLVLWLLPFGPLSSDISLLIKSLWELHGLWSQHTPQSESVEPPLEKKSILPTSTLQEDIAATLHNMRIESYNQNSPPGNNGEAATSANHPWDVDIFQVEANASTHDRLGVTTNQESYDETTGLDFDNISGGHVRNTHDANNDDTSSIANSVVTAIHVGSPFPSGDGRVDSNGDADVPESGAEFVPATGPVSNTAGEAIFDPEAPLEHKASTEPPNAEGPGPVDKPAPPPDSTVESNPTNFQELDGNDVKNTHQDEDSTNESSTQSTPTTSLQGLSLPSIVVQPPQDTNTVTSPPRSVSITDQTTSNVEDPLHTINVPAPRPEDPSSDNASSLSSVSLSSSSTGPGSDWSVVLPPKPTAAGKMDEDTVIVGPVVTNPQSDSFQDVPQQLADAMGPVDGEEST